jgi:hypothetical protein
MALQKTKTLANGASGDYWIAEPVTRKRNNTTVVTILLYKDAATRAAGGTPMHQQTAGVMGGAYKSGEEVYAWLKRSVIVGGKETNWFAGAADA